MQVFALQVLKVMFIKKNIPVRQRSGNWNVKRLIYHRTKKVILAITIEISEMKQTNM